MSAEELAAVGSLLTKDLGLTDLLRITDQKCTALSHGIVLGFMKRIAAKIAEGSKRSSLVGAHDALCRILHHGQMMSFGDLQNRVHLTGNSRIMNRSNRSCFIGNGILQKRLIQIHCIRTDVNKDRYRSLQDECIRSGAEGVARHDDLLSWLNVRKMCRHLKRRGAARRHQAFGGSGFFFHPGLTLLRKRPVSADLMIDLTGLLQIFHLMSDIRRNVKRNSNFHIVLSCRSICLRHLFDFLCRRSRHQPAAGIRFTM